MVAVVITVLLLLVWLLTIAGLAVLLILLLWVLTILSWSILARLLPALLATATTCTALAGWSCTVGTGLAVLRALSWLALLARGGACTV